MGGGRAEDFYKDSSEQQSLEAREGKYLRGLKKKCLFRLNLCMKNKMFFICLCAFLPENINTWVHCKAFPISGKGTQTH